jgi:cell wall-associated NlpC family hydrolase
MNYKLGMALVACGLTGALTFGVVDGEASAAGLNAGISSYTSSVITSSALPTAGFSASMNYSVAMVEDAMIVASAQPVVTANDAPMVASVGAEVLDMLVADVDDYVNVRSEASKDSESVGKLYKNNVGKILEEKDGWYKIESGNVIGWVKGKYVDAISADMMAAAGNRTATVQADALYVRSGASKEDSIQTRVTDGMKLTVVDESNDEWVKVSVNSREGYVSAEYVELATEFTYAESKEEEIARLAREEAARLAAEKAISSPKSTDRKYAPPAGMSGADVATYACQFVGNPYVYGGVSLTNGADCSGFVMSVYKQFGVSLPHSSRALRNSGYGVSSSDMKPGDIICYSGHVGIYIGNGQIVHASNRRDGIKISNVSYRALLAVRRIF